MSWSADQYLKFEAERNRPARDLLGAIPPLDARSAVDLGCGPGNSTELLAAQYPRATVCGIDRSVDMIAAARRRLPQLAFEITDLAAWRPAHPVDVLFANAVLQWVPDHAVLLPALLGLLAPGGSLAVQMPDNLDEPAHRLMREVAAAGPWHRTLARAAAARQPLADAAWYYGLLRAVCRRVDVWRTTYHHPLAGGVAGIVEWFSGTGLRPYLEPLDAAAQAEFLQRYIAAIGRVYQPLADGTVLLPLPRLFFVATR
jgi:trans-aconitate 2-methyltransferase